MTTQKYFQKSLSYNPVSFTERTLLASVSFKVMQATSAAKAASLFYTIFWFCRWKTLNELQHFPAFINTTLLLKKRLQNLILLNLLSLLC